ncbi:MAG: class I SAM-dependent methyltransferase [Planctomycetota bacterium]|nr:class I SAM-dependent methyltransferase [Planctomycetota bacterium]
MMESMAEFPNTPSAPWYVEAFSADYLSIYAHRNEASARRESKGAMSLLRFDPRGGRLLDLAAGEGRHSRAFATLGCAVTALDLSEDLSQGCAGQGTATVRGDMRCLPFLDWSFAGAAMFFSSFGYFDGQAHHEQTLAEVARILQPGGGLLLDLMDRETVAASLVAQSVESLDDDRTVEIQRWMTDDGKRVEKQICLLRRGMAERRWTESVHLFSEDELITMAQFAQLSVEGTWGDFDGSPHQAGKTRRLVVLRKEKQG